MQLLPTMFRFKSFCICNPTPQANPHSIGYSLMYSRSQYPSEFKQQSFFFNIGGPFFSMKRQIEYVSNFISNPLFTAPNTNSSSHKIHGSSMSFHSVTYQSLSFSRCFCFVSSSMANWRKIQSLIAIGEIFQCNDSFYKQYMNMGNLVGASNRFIHVYTKFTRSIAKLRVLVMR